jgi:hypothetical protein
LLSSAHAGGVPELPRARRRLLRRSSPLQLTSSRPSISIIQVYPLPPSLLFSKSCSPSHLIYY